MFQGLGYVIVPFFESNTVRATAMKSTRLIIRPSIKQTLHHISVTIASCFVEGCIVSPATSLNIRPPIEETLDHLSVTHPEQHIGGL
jgi:hypothetical protein